MRSVLLISLAVFLVATAEAVCAPQVTYSNSKLTIGYGETENVLYIPETNIAVGVATRQVYDFDTTATTATINPNVRAGSAASGAWAGDQTNGASARFTTYGSTMKPDGTRVYFSFNGKSLAQITLSNTPQGNYPVAHFVGDPAVGADCTEADGTAARVWSPKGPAIADATGDTVLVPVYMCHRLALVATNSPFTVTWKVGTGSSSTPTAAGYGTSAPIQQPLAVTSWRNRFYATNPASDLYVVYPAANWQLVIITSGTSPQATANDVPFDNTYHSAQAFWIRGSFSTWSNCWLHLFQQNTQVGHIVDPEGGNMFLLAGIASGGAKFASADLNGNVWVSKHAGNIKDLGKHSIAYTGCPAMSPDKCKWGYMTATATATATLQEVPPHTRTATPPIPTPTPITTAPATAPAAVGSSASATTSGAASNPAAATSAGATTASASTAATSAAASAATTSTAATTAVVGTTAAATTAMVGTTAAATTAVVGTTAAATSAAVTTTVATSTTAAVGSASSSSGSTGNGASSVTAAALALVTMVLAMF